MTAFMTDTFISTTTPTHTHTRTHTLETHSSKHVAPGQSEWSYSYPPINVATQVKTLA